MNSGQREIKFEKVLSSLLDRPSTAGSRKKLARAIDVTDATVSHYLGGRIRPSFATLVRIADYFNVSLDYLVFDERQRVLPEDDSASIRAQVRRAVVETSDLSGRHADLVTRISRQLQTQIDKAARGIVESGTNLGPVGFVTDAEAIGMEACIHRMRIMTRLFQSDVNDGEPGAFFEVLMANLRAGHPYQYLLYGARRDWQASVERFRALVESAGLPVDRMDCLEFRCLPGELVSSVCILDLDMPLIERLEPILLERHRDSISDGVWAYLSIERSDAQGGVTIEPFYLRSTLRQFERDWGLAHSI